LTLILILFAAGILTILLPCILPLIPIVLGTSIAGRSKLRPLMVICGMLFSFVVFTFILHAVLGSFPKATEYIRTATYYILLLFGIGFLTHAPLLTYGGALLGSLFFWPNLNVVPIAAVFGTTAMHFGGFVASWLQNAGARLQQQARQSIGAEHPLGAFLMGSTLGLVWVPCAGPALSFVLTLLRERPGIEAIILLTAYGLGTALPLLAIGYGGQYAVHSVKTLSRFSGRVKQVAGALLIFSAFALQLHWFRNLESWLVLNTSYGTLGTRIEEQFLGGKVRRSREAL
jgi:cytochrome c-type biogenesis protein